MPAPISRMWFCSFAHRGTSHAKFKFSEVGLYARRTLGGDRDYWRAGRLAHASRAVGSRVVAADEVWQQPETNWVGAAQLPRSGGNLPHGDLRGLHAFVAARDSAGSRAGEHDEPDHFRLG